MKNTIHYLQRYRKSKNVPLKEMARLLGVDAGNLSKVESGILMPSIYHMIAYHVILKIPVQQLIKKHYPIITKECLRNAIAYKDELMDDLECPDITKEIIRLDTIIDRLVEADSSYE
jgi:transcriptional regulator with XRE-family HTH domain